MSMRLMKTVGRTRMLGIIIAGILIYYLYFPTTTSPVRQTSAEKNEQPNILSTDTDLPREMTMDERVSDGMKLYSEKMKSLTEKKLLKTMDERNVCTKTTPPSKICHDQNCSKVLPPNGDPSLATFRSIFKPFTTIQDGIIDRLPELFGVAGKERRKYIFVMAVSENHYQESQAAIQSLHEKVFPHISNYTFYYYDMGLTPEQCDKVRQYGNASVRTYPFHLLPSRFKLLLNYTWKPLLIQAHIHLADVLVYMDASIRIQNMIPIFTKVKDTDFLMGRGAWSLGQHGALTMYSYYGDEACSYSSYFEFESGFLIFHNKPFSRRLLLEPWVACAIDPHCMSDGKYLKCNMGVRKYGKCHRFDQTVLTLILTKLFGDNISTFDMPKSCYVIRRRNIKKVNPQ